MSLTTGQQVDRQLVILKRWVELSWVVGKVSRRLYSITTSTSMAALMRRNFAQAIRLQIVLKTTFSRRFVQFAVWLHFELSNILRNDDNADGCLLRKNSSAQRYLVYLIKAITWSWNEGANLFSCNQITSRVEFSSGAKIKWNSNQKGIRKRWG